MFFRKIKHFNLKIIHEYMLCATCRVVLTSESMIAYKNYGLNGGEK
jgi:hypothetical protein